MKEIDHKLFNDKFHQFINRSCDVISTIDHPYSSPPIRVIDGHNNLKRISDNGERVLICVWDANKPNARSYRYELLFDTGIIACKNKDFYIFNEDILYPNQKPRAINFKKINHIIKLSLKNYKTKSEKITKVRDKKFLNNLNDIIKIYNDVILKSLNGTDFYINILYELYILLGLDYLSSFVKHNMISYYNSPLTNKWIPYCLEHTKEEDFGFINLLKKGLFKKPYFRSSNFQDDMSDINYIINNFEKIIFKIKNNLLIPSYEIFFWTLFLANIKHFGNDYGFFKKIENLLIDTIKKDSSIKLQLTKHNEDSNNVLEFKNDISFSYFFDNGIYKFVKNNNMKKSRISSINSAYCYLGKDLKNILEDVLRKDVKHKFVIDRY